MLRDQYAHMHARTLTPQRHRGDKVAEREKEGEGAGLGESEGDREIERARVGDKES